MYLDPGFGGMLVQVIVAVVAAGGAILFSFRKKIKQAFSKNKGKDAPPPAPVDTASDEDVIDTMDD